MPESIIDATQSAHGYLVSPLSDNISETDEGYLIIVGCPIARTGFQDYAVRDLPQEAAEALGVDLSNPAATISLYRPAEEVFAPEFLASLNGKPITDNHPPDFVNADNFKKYAMGHIQNPRKGDAQLDNGEWPLIADLVITAEPLISKVRDGTQRDVSLGYDYGIRRDGKKIVQCDMLGNHNAIVPKGRAGDLVSIQDAAPPSDGNGLTAVVAINEDSEVKPAPPADQGAATSKTSTAPLTQKEKKPVANILKHLLGLGLKSYAVDAEPEALATAVEAINQTPPAVRARAADAEEEEEEPVADKKKSKDRKKGKDDLGDPEDKDVEPPAVDAKRKGLHDALDKAMDRKKGKDADIEGLKNLLDQYLSEEEEEPEHAVEDGPADVSELEKVIGEETDAVEGEPDEEVVESGEEELEPTEDVEEVSMAAEDGMECAHCGTAHDAEACPECGCRDAKPKARAMDRARAADGALAALQVMRPFIARGTDKAAKETFNAALAAATRRSRPSVSSHSSFASAARTRDKARVRAADSNNGGADDRTAKLQAAYDKARMGGK